MLVSVSAATRVGLPCIESKTIPMTNPTELEPMRQLIASAARYAERASDKADRNEVAIRDLQQDVQRNGTRLDRVERRLNGIDNRLDSMDNRLDSMQAGIDRIEAMVLQLIEQDAHG